MGTDASHGGSNAAPASAHVARVLRFGMKYRHLGSAVHPGDSGDAETARAFAEDIQSLGPAFIKIGQALSVRPDLLPPAYLAALASLQDDTPAVPFDIVRRTVEEELRVGINTVFPRFDPQPLAAASLAQVHRATLRDGREVAVKVQRPGMREAIHGDLAALRKVARAADHLTEQGRRVLFAHWIDEMQQTLAEELDYTLEADNLRLFREHLADYPRLVVPQPIDDCCTGRVLTMDYIDGTNIGRATAIQLMERPRDELATELMRAYLDQIFVRGLVHADPHPGNVLLTDAGLALIDLGMVQRLGPRLRHGLLRMLAAAVQGDGDEVAAQTTALSEPLELYDERAWNRACGRLVTRFAMQSAAGGLSGGRLLIELTRASVASGLRPPPEVALLGRTLTSLEGVTCQLAPDLPPRDILRQHLPRIATRQATEDLTWPSLQAHADDALQLGREFPRQARRVMETLADNRLRVRITGLEESRLLENLQKIANRIAAGVISAALVIGAAIALNVDGGPRLLGYPALALVLFVLASVLAVSLIASAVWSDRHMTRYRRRER